MRWVGVWEGLGIMGERFHTECLDVATGNAVPMGFGTEEAGLGAGGEGLYAVFQHTYIHTLVMQDKSRLRRVLG